MTKKVINIAIDGPAGSGKSTVAKILSEKMNLVYLDTGAMYRAIAYYFLENGIQPHETEKINNMIDDIELSIDYIDNKQHVFINGIDVTNKIRTNEISMGASTISKNPIVRIKLVTIQREIAAQCNCVLDGRDIGSYVLPNANVKIYLTAKPEVRAQRRNKELMEKGAEDNFQTILQEIKTRDHQDMTRDFAPLICTEDAVQIDTSGLSIDEVVARIEKICTEL
ncbi:MAG TPA: (d)CMP kinase [Clostridia bacterium]|jgi:cytidylate kinase|nr:(d)CMP kinase [Clostridia bacterium]